MNTEHAEMKPIRLTTQTIIIEYENMNFDEFRFDTEWLYKRFAELIDANELSPRLTVFKSKRFEFTFLDGIHYNRQNFSKHNEMNSAIHIEIVSRDLATKTYKMQLFRQGKLKMCGVTTEFPDSSADFAAKEIEQLYFQLFNVRVNRLNVQIVMQNYISSLGLQEKERVDLINLMRHIKQDPAKLNETIKKCNQNVIHFDLS